MPCDEDGFRFGRGRKYFEMWSLAVRASTHSAGNPFSPSSALTSQPALLALGAPLGSLEGIDFLLTAVLFRSGMSGEVADTRFPLHCRVGITAAILPRSPFHGTRTSITLFHNRLARTSVVSTARFCHEGTFRPGLHG